MVRSGYSLVGGLVPGSSGGTSWFILLFLLWACKLLHKEKLPRHGTAAAAEKIDVVDICTPTSTHEDYVVRAAKLKCHVICEKPLTFDLHTGSPCS